MKLTTVHTKTHRFDIVAAVSRSCQLLDGINNSMR